MPTPAIPANFSAVRARSYVYRLPLFTRLLLFLIVAAWVATVALGDKFDVKAWGALVPEEVGIASCTFGTSNQICLSFFALPLLRQ